MRALNVASSLTTILWIGTLQAGRSSRSSHAKPNTTSADELTHKKGKNQLCSAEELLSFIVHTEDLHDELFGYVFLLEVELESFIPYRQPTLICNPQKECN
jgi:hypothetical protein